MAQSRQIGIVFPENAEIKIFRSVRGAARFLDVSRTAIIKAIRENRRVMGFEVFYVS